MDLQHARHRADYDTEEPLDAADALLRVEQAIDAFYTWREIKDESISQDYMYSLLFRDPIPLAPLYRWPCRRFDATTDHFKLFEDNLSVAARKFDRLQFIAAIRGRRRNGRLTEFVVGGLYFARVQRIAFSVH